MVRPPISQTLADDTSRRDFRAVHVAEPKGYAIGIPEIEFCDVAVQVLFGTMLIDALHPALEHTIETLNRISVDRPASVFAFAVRHVVVFGEMLTQMRILASLIGHDVRNAVHVRFDDRQQVGGGGSFDVERARTLTTRPTS